jgi:hypothetical protein
MAEEPVKADEELCLVPQLLLVPACLSMPGPLLTSVQPERRRPEVAAPGAKRVRDQVVKHEPTEAGKTRGLCPR